MAVRHYFIGANTGEGFVSCYDEFCPPESGVFLWVIKGGPGCGKSSFMKAIGRAAEQAGLDVDYVLCSGDPASVDGVFVPAWGVGYVDGTAPHVREVPYPAASGAYLDLGQFYRRDELAPKLPALMALSARYRAHYARAYEELQQAKALHDELEAVYNPHVDFDGVYRLAEQHIQKIKKSHCKAEENGVE